MPFNSFDDYPMSWKPERDKLKRPLYISLADQMEEDIREGHLAPNVKLPPQRELADFLDLNVSTVTKAYKLCESRGLLRAVVGKGSFVAPSVRAFTSVVDKDAHPQIDMSSIHPFYEVNSLVRDIALQVVEEDEGGSLFEYTYPLGTERQIAVGAEWLRRLGVDATPESTVIASGVQGALAILLSSLFEPEDKIAVDVYTYPNFISLANLLHLRLVAVPGDAQGMLPDELEKLCTMQGLKGVYLMPSGANPTNIRMSDERKAEIAEIVRKWGLVLLEDDNQTALAPEPPAPLQSLVPDSTVFIAGLSKGVSPGLRIAYLHVPDACYEAVVRGVYCHSLKLSSLNIEIATRLIESGAAQDIVARKRELTVRRNELYREAFPSADACMGSFTQWLQLPPDVSGSACEAALAARGVAVFGAERFSVGEGAACDYVRVATCTPRSDAELEQGLAALADFIARSRARTNSIIV